MSRRWDFPGQVKLIGGFAANISAAEQDQWDEYIKAHEVWFAYRAKKIDLAIAEARVHGGALDESDRIRQLAEEVNRLSDQLYQIGKDWYAQLTAKDKQKSEPEPDSQAPATEATPR